MAAAPGSDINHIRSFNYRSMTDPVILLWQHADPKHISQVFLAGAFVGVPGVAALLDVVLILLVSSVAQLVTAPWSEGEYRERGAVGSGLFFFLPSCSGCRPVTAPDGNEVMCQGSCCDYAPIALGKATREFEKYMNVSYSFVISTLCNLPFNIITPYLHFDNREDGPWIKSTQRKRSAKYCSVKDNYPKKSRIQRYVSLYSLLKDL